MGRLVRIPRAAAQARQPMTADEALFEQDEPRPYVPPAVDQDTYLERVAKYVPAEVLAFSLFINIILEQAIKAGGPTAMMAGFPVMTIATAALVVGAVLAPFFAWYVREDGDAWVVNAFVSFLAFPFWSYALGAVAFMTVRDGNLAAILLATFSVVSGLIKPRMPRLKKVKAARVTPVRESNKFVAPEPVKAAPVKETVVVARDQPPPARLIELGASAP
jgi:hypothetical protein